MDIDPLNPVHDPPFSAQLPPQRLLPVNYQESDVVFDGTEARLQERNQPVSV